MEDRRQFLKKFPSGCFVPTDNIKEVSTTEHPAKKTTFTNSPFRESSFDVHAEEYLRRTGHPKLGGKDFRSTLILVFDSEPPQEVMSRPFYMIYQLIDTKHLRMGFKGSANGRWYLSRILDVSDVMGGEIGKIDETCLGIVTGRVRQCTCNTRLTTSGFGVE